MRGVEWKEGSAGTASYFSFENAKECANLCACRNAGGSRRIRHCTAHFWRARLHALHPIPISVITDIFKLISLHHYKVQFALIIQLRNTGIESFLPGSGCCHPTA